MRALILPKQPALIVSYLKVGKLLYFGLSLFLFQSYIYYVVLIKAISNNDPDLIVFWSVCFIFSFIHIFLVLMDGWSRFQNYKRIKDQFYIHGFDVRLAANYKGSKCQRNAAIIAASELGMEKEIRRFFRKCGVKNHHFIPYFMIQDPLFPFRRSFWSRTFLEKPYRSKFDFRKIAWEQQQLKQGITD